MQWILYAVLVIILGVVGYYVGNNYAKIGPMWGAVGGVTAGVIISGVIWYSAAEPQQQF